MTETVNIIYRCLNSKNWKSVEDMASLMRISVGRCQLILTQLVMAGLAGVVAPDQPFAHVSRSQANRGPRL